MAENLSQEKTEGKNIPSRPFITKQQSAVLAQKLFALQMSPQSTVKELDSYDDRNFLVKGRLEGPQQSGENENEENFYVLKVTNALMSKYRDLFEVLSVALDYISTKGMQCPVPVKSVFCNKLVPCRLLGQDRNDDIGNSSTLDNYVDEKEITEGILLASNNNGDDSVCVVRMFTFVHGELLCEISWTNELLFDLGLKMAQLHKILKVGKSFKTRY